MTTMCALRQARAFRQQSPFERRQNSVSTTPESTDSGRADSRDAGASGDDSRSARSGRTELGSISVLIVFMALSLVLVAGLVFDAGAALTDRQRATDIAEQAARYSADQLEPAPAGATPLINTHQAQAAGLRFLGHAHVHGTVAASTTQVTVTVIITHRTALLSAVGKPTLTVTGTSTATPLRGLRTADPQTEGH